MTLITAIEQTVMSEMVGKMVVNSTMIALSIAFKEGVMVAMKDLAYREAAYKKQIHELETENYKWKYSYYFILFIGTGIASMLWITNGKY